VAAKEYLTEQIKYHTELLRLLWILSLAIGSGAVSLALGQLDPWRRAMMVVGFVLMIALGVGFVSIDRRVRAFIRSLKEAD